MKELCIQHTRLSPHSGIRVVCSINIMLFVAIPFQVATQLTSSLQTAMNLDSPELSKSLTYLIEVETLAQDIALLKEDKLELSNTLNKLRESIRALQISDEKRPFIKVGSLFVQHRAATAEEIIRRESGRVQEQYDKTSKELREKILKMRDLEHEPQIKGIGLKPLSFAEAKGLMVGFGLHQ